MIQPKYKFQPMCKTEYCFTEGKLTRGLCLACYQSAKRSTQSGEFTWEQLEEANLVNKTKDPRPYHNRFLFHARKKIARKAKLKKTDRHIPLAGKENNQSYYTVEIVHG